MSRIKNFFNEYFGQFSPDYPNEDVVRFLAKYSKEFPHGKMLDWGCGSGRHSLLGCHFGLSVTATDSSEIGIEHIKAKMGDSCGKMPGKITRYILNEGPDIKEIADENFDIILSWGVVFLNVAEEQQVFLNNICRMLKKGSVAFLNFRTQNDTLYSQRNEIAQEFISENAFIVGPKNRLHGLPVCILPLEEIEAMIKKAGLKIESLEKSEFTQENQTILNSYWHFTLRK